MNLVRGNWSPLLARFNNLDLWKALEIRWKLFGEQAWKALEVRWKLFGEQSWHNSHTPSSGNRSADYTQMIPRQNGYGLRGMMREKVATWIGVGRAQLGLVWEDVAA